jgi:hypothetical protein
MQLDQSDTEIYDLQNNVLNETPPGEEMTTTNLDEAQIFLACRAYLSKRNKLRWEGKKVRREAAPLFNEGYFWNDPNELIYLRENPDPFNLPGNETINQEAFDSIYKTGYAPLENSRVEYSTNPFSTTPLYPSDEHVRRSESRKAFWGNQTWKEAWYEKRWNGRKVTREERARKNTKRRLNNMPAGIFNSPEFASLDEEEVVAATLSYIQAREKMSEAKKQLKQSRLAQREEFREWRRILRKEAEEIARVLKTTNTTRQDIIPRTNLLSFEPSPDVMTGLKAKRSLKAKRAYQNRMKKKAPTSTETMKEKIYLGNQHSRDESGSIDAILRINDALDSEQLPSIDDVVIILKPCRLGRRRSLLLRILDECFALNGKCVPRQINDQVSLHFATSCSINELGIFVLSLMTNSTGKS